MSANGVRGGIVIGAGTVTSGALLPVGVTVKPLLDTAPPLSVSPTNPVAPVHTIPISG